MALTSHIVKHIDLAHEPGQWIEARMPSKMILDRAAVADQRKALENWSGVDFSGLEGFVKQQSEQAQQKAKKPGDGFDWPTVLGACVTAWSYDAEVTPENVADLDEVTVEAVMAALIPQEEEGERKNG